MHDTRVIYIPLNSIVELFYFDKKLLRVNFLIYFKEKQGVGIKG